MLHRAQVDLSPFSLVAAQCVKVWGHHPYCQHPGAALSLCSSVRAEQPTCFRNGGGGQDGDKEPFPWSAAFNTYSGLRELCFVCYIQASAQEVLIPYGVFAVT